MVSSSSLTDANNPNTRIVITNGSIESGSLASLSKKRVSSSPSLGRVPSRTSLTFFQPSNNENGKFEPLNLKDIFNVLGSSESTQAKRPKPSTRNQPHGSGHFLRSKYDLFFSSGFLLNLLNGLIGMFLMLFSVIVLTKIGDSYAYPFFEYQETCRLILTMEFIRWCVFTLWSFGAYLLVVSVFELIPRFLFYFSSFSENGQLSEGLFQLAKLRPLLVLFAVSLFACFLSNAIFHEAPHVGSSDKKVPVTWQFIIRRSNIAIACFFGVFLIEKLFIQKVSAAFHHLYYSDRIKSNNSRLGIIMALKKYAMSQSSIPLSHALSGLFAHIIGITSEYFPSEELNPLAKATSVENYDQDHYHEESILLSTQIFFALKQALKMNQQDSADHRYLDGDGLNEGSISTLANENDDENTLHLKKEDFRVIFESEEDAVEAFNFLDENGNGDLSVNELASNIISTFKERSAILKSLLENKSIIKQLDSLALVVLSILFLLFTLQLFDFPTSSIAAFGTVFFGLSFIFGNLAANLLTSVVFIFISHPYDVGDKVSFDSYSEIKVHEMGLLSTTFIANDGRILYIQNHNLFQKPIYNIRRSLPQTETISLIFPLDDVNALISSLYELKERVGEFFHANSRDYYIIDNWFKPALESSSKLRLDILVSHRSNFQDMELKNERSEKFNLFLAKQLRACNLNDSR